MEAIFQSARSAIIAGINALNIHKGMSIFRPKLNFYLNAQNVLESKILHSCILKGMTPNLLEVHQLPTNCFNLLLRQYIWQLMQLNTYPCVE